MDITPHIWISRVGTQLNIPPVFLRTKNMARSHEVMTLWRQHSLCIQSTAHREKCIHVTKQVSQGTILYRCILQPIDLVFPPVI